MNPTAWRAALVIAAVYGHFLIFAQFSFVELLRAGGTGLREEKVALGTMAVAGIAGGFLAAWRGVTPATVRVALAGAGLCALVAPFATSMPGALCVALVTGGALGMATVSLAALLPGWCGIAWVGVGTGLGYACCNLPAIFMQSPAGQAWVGSAFAFVGLFAVPPTGTVAAEVEAKRFPLWSALAVFTALVWLDSAAFFIIQHETDFKSGTWGEGLLWRNVAVHLIIAIAAGLWLARGGFRVLLMLAWTLLAVAALAVNEASTRSLAGWLYPAGVSLYSTALVACPGWFSGAQDTHGRAWRAASLFALAGWFGSANGIGMAQTLHRVPIAFVLVTGAVIVSAFFLTRSDSFRSLATVATIAAVAIAFPRGKEKVGLTDVDRGHRVYLSEGCIHCHSRYVRPGSRDELDWGPPREVADVLKEQPVLIGNRRQGPDLSNVAARRSSAWLKLHFINPRAVVPDSCMPSYAHLFTSRDGDDLISFLTRDSAGNIPAILETASRWQPAAASENIDARNLFTNQCATCHGSEGRGDGPLAPKLARPPANLVSGPFVWTAERENRELRVARVIKFGLPGTDMPGHETLTDSQIKALAGYVLDLRQMH